MNLRRDKRSEAGFSLAEILVVLVIIGLAAAVFVPNTSAFFQIGRASCRERV